MRYFTPTLLPLSTELIDAEEQSKFSALLDALFSVQGSQKKKIAVTHLEKLRDLCISYNQGGLEKTCTDIKRCIDGLITFKATQREIHTWAYRTLSNC